VRILLNTRSFERDYQWFSLDEDNSISISKNQWENREFSKLPIMYGFGIILGKLLNGELYLLVMDTDSNRIDNKGRSIANSFLFTSIDEVIIRKLVTIFLFNYNEFIDTVNSEILDLPGSEFGFSIDYAQIINIIEFFANRYDVKFEFDSETNERRFCKFAELYLPLSTTDENGSPVIEYRLNPIFESKLKKFLLTEIFPDNFSTLFAYFPNLSMSDIEKGEIYLSVTRELDKFARAIFIKDSEEWAKFELKEKLTERIQSIITQHKIEILSKTIAILIFLPLIYLYINVMSENSMLSAEKLEFDSKLKNISKELDSYVLKSDELQTEIKIKDQNISILQTQLNNLKNNKTQITAIQNINNLNADKNKNLDKCLNNLKNEQKQRSEASRLYRWYKKEFEECSGVE
jgi:hypothetical protein